MEQLKGKWEEFSRRAVHPDTAPESIRVLRATFYFGALALMNSLLDAAGGDGDREQTLIELSNELGDFAREEQAWRP